jgi:hypothetical protein
LKGSAEEEEYAAHDPQLDEARQVDRSRRSALSMPYFEQGQWRERARGDQRPRGDEEERPDFAHRRLLEIEGQPPDGGGEQQQKIGGETFHGIPWLAAPAGWAGIRPVLSTEAAARNVQRCAMSGFVQYGGIEERSVGGMFPK